MLRVGICDDRQKEIDIVRTLAARFSDSYPQYPMDISSYASAYDLLDEVERTGGCDVYLLDILMPQMSGIELAQKIRKRGERAQILFLTSSREYGIEAIGVKAAGYLLKPIQEAPFREAMHACIRELQPERYPSLPVKTKQGLVKVQLAELMSIESFNHICELTLSDGTKLNTPARLSELYEQLRGNGGFISPHRAYIVNMEYIRGISSTGILMTDGRRLPVSRKGYSDIKTAYLDYITRL